VKVVQGVRIKTFKEEFLLKDNIAYSLQKLYSFVDETNKSQAIVHQGENISDHIKNYVKETMVDNDIHSELLMILKGVSASGEEYVHAASLVRIAHKIYKKPEVAFYCSN
jgi:hypothetical protein